MTRGSSALTVTVFVAGWLSAVALAQAPALNVKLGLWEVTSTFTTGGAMPTIDTSKMTPEQKAAVEAMLKQRMGPQSSTLKSCMTKEKLEKSMFINNDEAGVTCKRNMTANTPTVMDATVACTGARPMTGVIHIQAASPDNITATMKMSMTQQGKPMTVDSTFVGKWLGADCGDIK